VITGELVERSPTGVVRRYGVERKTARLCISYVGTDATIEIDELPSKPPVFARRMPARVIGLSRPAPRVAVLTLRTPPSEKMTFRPGQYVMLIGNDGRPRPFSIANAPRLDRTIDLHVEKIDGGGYTTFVHEALGVGEIVQLEGPYGFFGLNESRRSAVFVAGGTGIAPIRAMLESMSADGTDRAIRVYWGGRDLDGLYQVDEIQDIVSRFDGAQFVPILSSPRNEDRWTGRVGRPHAAAIEDFADVTNTEVYACGSTALVGVTRREFFAQGLPKDRFFFDAFGVE
jgi:CDP-4-dehydro-6-deoxyglucose reductase